MESFKDYIDFREEIDNEKIQQNTRWNRIEAKMWTFCEDIILPSLKKINEDYSIFSFEQEQNKEGPNSLTHIFEIELYKNNIQPEKYFLKIELDSDLEKDNMRMELENYHSDNKVKDTDTFNEMNREEFEFSIIRLFKEIYAIDYR